MTHGLGTFWHAWITLLSIVGLTIGAQSLVANPTLEQWSRHREFTAEQQAAMERMLESAPLTFADLDALVELYSHADPSIKQLLNSPPSIPAAEYLAKLPSHVAADLAVRIAAQHCFLRQYDSAIAWIEAVDVSQCSAVPLYWYYQAVACHRLVRMEQAANAVEQLHKLGSTSERRIAELARLISRDAEAYEEGSLVHVKHMMHDVQRRLILGQGDARNQQLQEKVVATLDKLIQQAEQQRKEQQQQAQQSAQMAQQPGAKPMGDSRIAEQKGSGDVDQRELPTGGDWGSLPPAERERVTQQVIRDFPSHYREVIKNYFKRMASESGAGEEGK